MKITHENYKDGREYIIIEDGTDYACIKKDKISGITLEMDDHGDYIVYLLAGAKIYLGSIEYEKEDAHTLAIKLLKKYQEEIGI